MARIYQVSLCIPWYRIVQLLALILYSGVDCIVSYLYYRVWSGYGVPWRHRWLFSCGRRPHEEKIALFG